MEKREERKKEALARLEHTKKNNGKDADADTSQINMAENDVDNSEQKIAAEVLVTIKSISIIMLQLLKIGIFFFFDLFVIAKC